MFSVYFSFSSLLLGTKYFFLIGKVETKEFWGKKKMFHEALQASTD